MNRSPLRDILLVSRFFPPEPGGIQEMAYSRCLQDHERVVVMTQGASTAEFDQEQSFPIYRWRQSRFPGSGAAAKCYERAHCLTAEVLLALKLFRKYRFRHIEWFHGYDSPALLALTCILPARFHICLHGHDVLSWTTLSLKRSLLERTLNRMDTVVCACSFVREFLEKHYRIDRPIQVINPAVRPSKFGDLPQNLTSLRDAVRKKHGIPTDAILLLSVGRLVRRKGIQRVIRILPSLLESSDIYYLVSGRGPMEIELRELAASLGLQQRVIFAGYVPDCELAGYYAASDIFVMLSFLEGTSIEGFGIVCLEAAYFGAPAVVSNVGGMKDSVRHGETGFLANPDSSDEVAAALLELCRNRELRARLGRNARAFARSRKLEWLRHPEPSKAALVAH